MPWPAASLALTAARYLVPALAAAGLGAWATWWVISNQVTAANLRADAAELNRDRWKDAAEQSTQLAIREGEKRQRRNDEVRDRLAALAIEQATVNDLDRDLRERLGKLNSGQLAQRTRIETRYVYPGCGRVLRDPGRDTGADEPATIGDAAGTGEVITPAAAQADIDITWRQCTDLMDWLRAADGFEGRLITR